MSFTPLVLPIFVRSLLTEEQTLQFYAGNICMEKAKKPTDSLWKELWLLFCFTIEHLDCRLVFFIYLDQSKIVYPIKLR